MSELITEIIFKTIFDILISYPGAFVRWFLVRGKKPFTEVLKEIELNCFIGYIFIAAIVILIAFIKFY